MPTFEKIQPDIYLLKVPFSGLWTGVVLVRGEENCLIDSGAKDTDVDAYILPALAKLGLSLSDISWLLNTHSHGDHIGGHARITQLANVKVAAHLSSAPKVSYPVPYAIETRTKFPEHSPAPQCYLQGVGVDRLLLDGDIVAGRLQVIHTPGHDDDCVCWYDLKTKTLITGDSLQANGTPAQGVGFYKDLDAYLASVDRLQKLPIDNILCGHEYDKIGWDIRGRKAVAQALRICAEYPNMYHDFVWRHYQAGMKDPVELAKLLIQQHGCGMPDKLFLALYTVTQHLQKIENTLRKKRKGR
jgi:glyoxylase-like metal-dependent hydrolase (beta-lactamase superfamily II)